jgi:hypothetical protein
MVLQKAVPGLCSETCPHPASTHDADHVISMKAEEDSDREVAEEPLAKSFPGINYEHMVSYMPVCTVGHFSQISRVGCCLSCFHLSISVSVHIKQIVSCEWILNRPV